MSAGDISKEQFAILLGQHRAKRDADTQKSLSGEQSHKLYHRILRLRALKKLGGTCVKCGEKDVRVLQFNHKGSIIVKSDYRQRYGFGGSRMLRGIISGAITEAEVEIRCSNCNILYEYEREALTIPIQIKERYLNDDYSLNF